MYRSSPGVFIWHKWRKKKTEWNLLTHVHLETAVSMEMVWMVSNCFVLWAERTEKVSLGSIKTVVSEPIEGHQEYHIMVCWNECFIYYFFFLYWLTAFSCTFLYMQMSVSTSVADANNEDDVSLCNRGLEITWVQFLGVLLVVSSHRLQSWLQSWYPS